MSIAENIRKIRKVHDLKQSELAKKLNVSHATVSSWETGRTEPNIGMVEKMCEIFNCSKSELIDGEISYHDKRLLAYAFRLANLPDDKRKQLLDYLEFLEAK